MNKIKVMFVCMGNICRSPTAHAVMQHKVDQRGLSERFEIESSGTHAYHIGEQSDSRSRQLARTRGVDMEYIRAQKIAITDYDYYDYILAMDRDNLHLIEYYAPENHDANVKLFLSYVRVDDEEEVPDPYYGGAQGFENVFNLIEVGCDGLIDALVDNVQDDD